MGVRKFRSVADMPAPPPLPPLDVENLRGAFSLMAFAFWLSPWVSSPGVRKFRSMVEANEHRIRWGLEQVRRPQVPLEGDPDRVDPA